MIPQQPETPQPVPEDICECGAHASAIIHRWSNAPAPSHPFKPKSSGTPDPRTELDFTQFKVGTPGGLDLDAARSALWKPIYTSRKAFFEKVAAFEAAVRHDEAQKAEAALTSEITNGDTWKARAWEERLRAEAAESRVAALEAAARRLDAAGKRMDVVESGTAEWNALWRIAADEREHIVGLALALLGESGEGTNG